MSLAAAGLALVVLATERLTPLGVAHAILYLPVVVVTLWSPRRVDPLWAAALCTVLALVGIPISGGEPDVVTWANRSLSIAALWITAYGVRMFQSSDRFLRDRESQMGAILRTAVDAVITIDDSGTVISVNPAAERMFGYGADELVGHNVRILMPSPHREGHDGYIRRYLDSGQPRIIGIGREVLGLRKDGTTFPLDLGVGEWRDGRPMFTAILRDLSERKVLEQEVQQAQKLEAVGRLAGGIAHDFNNLLMGIISCCRIAAGKGSGDQVQGQVAEIQSAAERGAALTRQLLTFSRRREVVPEAVLLDEVSERLETMLARLLGEDVELRVELRAGGGHVLADPSQLEQVLMNLAVNARDAMPHGGRLSIRTRIETCDEPGVGGAGGVGVGQYVTLDMADDGCGMPEDVKAKAFDPFFTTKADTEGTGLGLSTVYGIVRQLGGHMHLETEVGRGTRFVLHLPRAAPPEPPPRLESEAQAQRSADGPPDAGETVLLVEDDRLVRAGVRHILEGLGYQVLVAGGGADALRVCQEHRGVIDLLLSDILMPGMAGGELAREVVARRPGVRVLFMSALPNEVLVEQGRLEAGQPSLHKPFEEQDLAAAVRSVLDGTAG